MAAPYMSMQCALRAMIRAQRRTHPHLELRNAHPRRKASSSSSSGRKRTPAPPITSKTIKPLPSRPTPPSKAPSPSARPPHASSASTTSSSTSSSTSAANPNARPGSKTEPVRHLLRTRFIGLLGTGAAALCLGSFTASLAYLYSQPLPPSYAPGREPCIPTGRPAIQSPLEFDLHLDKSEQRYGITAQRRLLGASARGHVLEVAAGAGRNLEFLDWAAVGAELVSAGERNRALLEKSGGRGRAALEEVRRREMRSYTGVDIDAEMLEVGLRRVRGAVPGGADLVPKKVGFAELSRATGGDGSVVSLLGGKLRLLRADAQGLLPRPPSGFSSPLAAPSLAAKDDQDTRYYDTVLQTFGLCSVRDPVSLIANMASVVRPGTGRIILLEHGRSWWDVVNGLLDRTARGHFDRFGCWWNRDIEGIVEEAARRNPRLEVVELKRPGWKFGTHFWIELRVRQSDVSIDGSSTGVVKEKEGQRDWSRWWSFGSNNSSPKPAGSTTGET